MFNSPKTQIKVEPDEDDDCISNHVSQSQPLELQLKEEELHIKNEVFIDELETNTSQEGGIQVDANFSRTRPSFLEDLIKLMATNAHNSNNTFSNDMETDSDGEAEMERDPLGTQLIYQFKVVLLGGIQPPVWREIQVSGSYTFHDLHLAIQKSMGWKSVDYDYHLHQFEVENPRTMCGDIIGEPLDYAKDEKKVLINKYFKCPGDVGKYEYDLGFGWEHDIILEKTFSPVEGEIYPKCIDGKRACPPEDVAGLGGSYEEFCDAINDPDNEQHAEFTEWLGSNKFDPEEFSPEMVFVPKVEAGAAI